MTALSRRPEEGAADGRGLSGTVLFYTVAQGASLLGSQVMAFALSVYVVQQTAGTTLWTLILFSGYLAASLAGFTLARSLDRRNLGWVLVAAHGLGLVIAIVLLAVAVAGLLTPYVLLGTNFVSGISIGILQPTFLALIPRLVTESQIPRAQGLASATTSTAYVVAPGLGAALYAVGGVGLALLLNMLTFLIPLGAVLWLRLVDIGKPLDAPAHGTQRRRTWPYDRRTSWLVALMVAVNLLLGTRQVLRAPMVLDSLNGSEAVYAVVQVAAGVGGVMGGLVLARWGAGKQESAMLGILVIGSGAAGQLASGVFDSPWAWTVSTFVISFLAPYVAAIGFSLILVTADAHERGRSVAVATASVAAALPVSVLLGGLAADVFDQVAWVHLVIQSPPAGVRLVLALSGLITVAVGVLWILLSGTREAEPDCDRRGDA